MAGRLGLRKTGKSKTKTHPETIAKDRAARAKREAERQEESMKVTAVARRWGFADWVLPSPEPLWQVRVEHSARGYALHKGAFKKDLIETVSKALCRHPARPRVSDLKTLFKEAKVKVLNGAPPQPSGCDYGRSNDPDHMGFIDWEPVLYVAGATPVEALVVIQLVMEEKVLHGLLPGVPKFTLVWALGPGEEPPRAALPELWSSLCEIAPRHEPHRRPLSLPNPFEVLPPLHRRHLLGHLEAAVKTGPSGSSFYDLKIYGGTFYFRFGLDRLKIPNRQMSVPPRNEKEWVRILYSLDGGDGNKALIQKVLVEALRSVPLLLTCEVEDDGNAFLQWLLDQPSVILRRSAESLQLEAIQEAEEAKQQLQVPLDAGEA